MGWLKGIAEVFKTIGLALGMIKREEEKRGDFAIAAGASKGALIEGAIDAQKGREAIHSLSESDLNSELRASGAGGKRTGP